MEKKFSATLSLVVKIITYGVGWGIGVVLPFFIGVFIGPTGNYIAYGVGVFVLLILGFTYTYRPTGYVVTATEIRIQRPRGDVVIERSNVASVERFHKTGSYFSLAAIRLFGSGGFYGGFGLFWNKAWGTFYAYVTRTDTMVVITPKEGRRVLVSPDDADGFVSAAIS